MIYCERDVADNLTSGGEENEVEADTIILSAYANLRESCDGAVIIESEDTGVYVQAGYVTHNLTDDLFIKKRTLCLRVVI